MSCGPGCSICDRRRKEAATQRAEYDPDWRDRIFDTFSVPESARVRSNDSGRAWITFLPDNKVLRIGSGDDYEPKDLFPLIDTRVWPSLKYYPRLHYLKRIANRNVSVMDRMTVCSQQDSAYGWDYEEFRQKYPDLYDDVIEMVEGGVQREAKRLGIPPPGDLHLYNIGWDRNLQVKVIDIWNGPSAG